MPRALVLLLLVLWTGGCEGKLCNLDNLTFSVELTEVAQCCGPGTELADDHDQGGNSRCSCPRTGDGAHGIAVCNDAGNGFECTECPPPYDEGNACEYEGELACQVLSLEEARGLGHAEIPVMHCEGGTWTRVFTCAEDICGDVSGWSAVWCGGNTLALEGAACERQTEKACTADRTTILGCSGVWMPIETCPAGQLCTDILNEDQDFTVVCQ